MRQIFGAIAEYEKTMIVLKLRGARMRAKAKNGRCEGAKPYGVLPGEGEVIERMAELTGVKSVRIQQTQCYAKGAPHCEWSITWE